MTTEELCVWLGDRAVLLVCIIALIVLLCPSAEAKYHDPHQRAAFMKQHPCPSTGKTYGRCEGWIVDHVRPLCKGGADRPSNMQWMTREDAKRKDKWECK